MKSEPISTEGRRGPGAQPPRPPGGRPWTGLAVALAGAAVVLGACSGGGPPETAPAPERFEWAVERYRAGDYGGAVEGFRSFMVRNPLHENADSAQYLLASSFLERGDAVQAANEFSQLASTRPGSSLADDAQFGACRAYWEASPAVARTQENTRAAIEACRRLTEFFPESPLIPDAEGLIQEAREKLAAKQYRIARYYFDEGFYESANIYLEAVLSEYPEAPVVPEVLATLYRSYTELGFESEAQSVRKRLLSEYSDSPEAQRLEGMSDNGGGG